MKMKSGNRVGFTLVEMLVVVVILGILMGLLLPNVGRARERARRAACASNLRQLHTAAINCATDHKDGHLPWPVSTEGWHADRAPTDWRQHSHGWVDWYSYQPHSESTQPPIDSVKTDWWGDRGVKCIEKGILYKYLKDIRVYMCPTMAYRMRNDKGISDDHRKAVRGYIMNGAIHKQAQDDASFFTLSNDQQGMSRRMLFSDVAYKKNYGATWALDTEPNDDDDPDKKQWYRRWHRASDGMLEWDRERIGDWHEGKANVVFLDGHVETVDPKANNNRTTEYICTGEWGE